MQDLLPLAAPLAAGILWTLVALLPGVRRTFRTPGMRAFALFALFLALYAVFDALAGADPRGREVWFRPRGVALTLTAPFLLLSCRWLSLRRRRTDLLLALPALAFVGLWAASGVALPPPAADGYLPGPLPVSLPWALYLVGYSTAGLYFLSRGALVLRRGFGTQYLQVGAILASVTLAVLAGLLGNVLLSLVGAGSTPLFGLALLAGGAAFLAAALPMTPEWISALIRRLVTARREVLQAFLVYHGGTLIAARRGPGHEGLDEDLFSASLEAFQQFMHTSFPFLRMGWLDTIEHGGLKILLERGDHCFLALVTTGREDDVLRGEMGSVVRRFEARNAALLPRWNGRSQELEGVDEALGVFFDLPQLF